MCIKENRYKKLGVGDDVFDESVNNKNCSTINLISTSDIKFTGTRGDNIQGVEIRYEVT